ncbi:hypothetical protein SAMN04488071_3430 [Kordiimonas lacus]|uniref:Uncharacterized protein n=1 Tax=Kordiimonas lacus TaxID=637679 RepID=A0A1G7EFX7_9PROT|nr:hypothetical protein [Kordiimonas lacus]SDE62541.1 hypothetical protein SAMN04488071_3430 [Kordiimonas lacus]
MRLAIAIAAFGLVLGAPVVVPTSFMNQAEAQSTATLPAAEQASVDAAIDAVLANTALTADQITQQIATIVQNSSNPAAAAKRVAAKVSSTPGLSTAVVQATGAGLMQVVTNLQSTNPAVASDIQVTVAMSSSADFQIGYVNGPTTVAQLGGNNQQTGGQQAGGQQQGSTQTPVVRRTTTRRTIVPPRPRIPTTPIVPVIVEPNPAQAGSPT